MHSRWPIAISYHCPVAAVRARALHDSGGARRNGGNEEGADGTVFFAAKWQRARANRVGTSAATSQEESTREPPTSPRSQQAHPPTHRQQTVGRVYRSLGPSFLFRIFSEPLPLSCRHHHLSPRLATFCLASRYIRFLYPRHGACSKIFDFRADGTCRAEGSSPSCSAAAAAAAAAAASLSSASSFSFHGGPL